MTKNLKEEYQYVKDLEINILSAIKNPKAKKKYVDSRFKIITYTKKLPDTPSNYRKKVLGNATHQAIKIHTKECHKHGITIYGKQLKRGW